MDRSVWDISALVSDSGCVFCFFSLCFLVTVVKPSSVVSVVFGTVECAVVGGASSNVSSGFMIVK